MLCHVRSRPRRDLSAVGAVACTADMSASQQERRRRRHCERGFGTVPIDPAVLWTQHRESTSLSMWYIDIKYNINTGFVLFSAIPILGTGLVLVLARLRLYTVPSNRLRPKCMCRIATDKYFK